MIGTLCRRPAAAPYAVVGLAVSVLLAAATQATADDPVVLPSQPAVSPDGKQIAFSWRGDIWTASVDGGRARRLTTHEARDTRPVYSPDGKRIAFVSDRGIGPQIYLVPSDGGEPVAVTAHTAGYSVEGWYPDGTHLLVSAQRDHYWRRPDRLFRIRAAEKPEARSGEELLFDDYGTEPALSPDGKRVLFVREGVSWWRKGYVGSQDAQIWLYDLDFRQFSKLVADPGGCRWPLWKPAGDGFYYVGAEKGSSNFYEYDLKSKTSKQRTSLTDDGPVFPSISSDGSTIVYRRLFDLYRWHPGKDGPPQKIELTAAADDVADSTRRVSLTKASDGAFTADGLEIAFIAGGDVWVMDTELREPKQVTDTPEEERDVLFAPDGESLYFVSDRDGRPDIWRAKRGDTKQYWWRNDKFPVERITDDGEMEQRLKFSPDGSKLAYVRGRGELWTRKADGKDAKRILDGWSVPDYAWSPDGQWFAHGSYDDEFNRDIWIRKADGSGTPYNVSRHPDNDGTPAWSPDGKVLAFVGRRTKEETDIHYVWLQKADDERSTRDRTLESALEKIQKARRKPTASPTGSGTTSAGASSAGATSATPTPNPFATPPPPSARATGTAPAAKPTGTAAAGATDPATAGTASSGTAASSSASASTAAAGSTSTAAARGPAVVIDFDGLHERLRRVPIADADESELIWAPDSKRLAFTAEIKGQRGLYAVSFPSPGSPSLVVGETGSGGRWLSEGNQVVWISQGVPASVATASNKQTEYRFTARQTVDQGRKYLAAFDQCWRTMRDHWYDERLGNRNWDEIRRKYSEAAAAATDEIGLTLVVSLMLGELNGSHLGFTPTGLAKAPDPATWPIVTAHLGVRFDPSHKGPGLKIRDVIARGPADQNRSRLAAGEIITSIDGTAVEPAMDLTRLLNGPAGREIRLKVKKADGTEREVTLRGIEYGAVGKLLYEQWVRANRAAVEKATGGSLGYLHIAGMDEPSLLRFEEELYSAGAGKAGLVIDIRENGGGFTTDHLLTMLTQPQHAITVPRGGKPGYPQDRKIYAAWNKPIVVVCNQNCFSNAEIFSHAIKQLGRGKLVGVTTAGGVVSTGAVTIMDAGVLRLPFRGWYVGNTGEDMELHGAVPDVEIWPEPGQFAAGKDVQLDKAIDVLRAEVKKWESRPQPKLRKATER
jgi:tricorn protease